MYGLKIADESICEFKLVGNYLLFIILDIDRKLKQLPKDTND